MNFITANGIVFSDTVIDHIVPALSEDRPSILLRTTARLMFYLRENFAKLTVSLFYLPNWKENSKPILTNGVTEGVTPCQVNTSPRSSQTLLRSQNMLVSRAVLNSQLVITRLVGSRPTQQASSRTRTPKRILLDLSRVRKGPLPNSSIRNFVKKRSRFDTSSPTCRRAHIARHVSSLAVTTSRIDAMSQITIPNCSGICS